jgi:hypothetical protein
MRSGVMVRMAPDRQTQARPARILPECIYQETSLFGLPNGLAPAPTGLFVLWAWIWVQIKAQARRSAWQARLTAWQARLTAWQARLLA